MEAMVVFMGTTDGIICLRCPSDSTSHSADDLDQLKGWRLHSFPKL